MAGGGRESRRFSIPAPVLRAEAKQQTGFARPTYESALASVGGVTLGAGIGVLFSLRLFPAAPGLGAMLGAVTGLFLAAASPLGTWPEEVGMGMWGSGATVLGLEAFGWQPAGSGSTLRIRGPVPWWKSEWFFVVATVAVTLGMAWGMAR